uniref:Polyprotein n=1 Tax=Downy ground fern nepovirus TaxID=3115766 RepID=A0AAT9JAY6_9SECO
MVACNQQPSPRSHPRAPSGALGGQLGRGAESPSGIAADDATGVTTGDTTPAAAPVGCCHSCPLRQSWTKTGLKRAVQAGELAYKGRSHCCGALVNVSVVAHPVVQAHKVPKGRPTRQDRVTLPYKKQTCAVVVQAGPLELVYAPLVQATCKVAKSAPASAPQAQAVPELPLWLAPKWMVPEPPRALAPRAPLTQRQEFALLKRRLVLKGKAINRSQRRERIDRAYQQRCAQAAYRAAYDAAVQHVRQVASRMGQREVIRDLMREPELTKAQEAFVASACQKAREDQARREAWLASVKRRERKECPHVRPREEVQVLRVVPECTTPWAHLGLHITFLRGEKVIDGTLGAKSHRCEEVLFLTKRIPKRNPLRSATRIAPSSARVIADTVVEKTTTPETREIVSPDELPDPQLLPRVEEEKQPTTLAAEEKCAQSETFVSEVDEEPIIGKLLDDFDNDTAYLEVEACREATRLSYGKGVRWYVLKDVEDVVAAHRFFLQIERELAELEDAYSTGRASEEDLWKYGCIFVEEAERQYKYLARICRTFGLSFEDVYGVCWTSTSDRYLHYRLGGDPSVSEWETDSEPEEEELSSYSEDEDAPEEVDNTQLSDETIVEDTPEEVDNTCTSDEASAEDAPGEEDKDTPVDSEDEEEFSDADLPWIPPPPPMPDWYLRDVQQKYCQIQNVAQGNFISRPIKRTRNKIPSDISAAAMYYAHCLRLQNERYADASLASDRFQVAWCRKEKYVKKAAAKCFPSQLFLRVWRVKGVVKYDEDDFVVEWQKIWNAMSCLHLSEVASSVHEQRANGGEIEKPFLSTSESGPECSEHNICPAEPSSKPCFFCTRKQAAVIVPGWKEVFDPHPSGGYVEADRHYLYSTVEHVPCHISKVPNIDKLLDITGVEFLWLAKKPSIEQHMHLHYFAPIVAKVEERYYRVGRSKPTQIPIVMRQTTVGNFISVNSGDEIEEYTCHGGPSEIQERMEDLDQEVPSIDSLVQTLKKRRTAVKGSGENRVADKATLTERAVFRSPGVLKKVLGSKHSKVAANATTDNVAVEMQPQGKPTFTPLPRMGEEQLRRLLEEGMGSTSSVALDLGIQSHIPQGLPIVAFMNLMDTRIDDPKYASLCGSFIDLGKNRAKTLCLPLANFPISKLAEDADDVLNGLVLATYFQDPTQFRQGRKAFQYGAVEFQEYNPSAHSDYTRVRDSWDSVVNHIEGPRDRIVAGFSCLGGVSQDADQSLPRFEKFDLKCPPSNKPVVSTYGNIGQLGRLASGRRFTVPSIDWGTAGGRRGKDSSIVESDGASSSRREGPRGFGAEGRELSCDAPTLATTDAPVKIYTDIPVYHRPPVVAGDFLHPSAEQQCNAGNVTPVAYVYSGKAPKDAKEGTLLTRLQLRKCISEMKLGPYHEWLQKGLCSMDVKLKLTTASNPFVGLTLAISLDTYGRVDEDLSVVPSVVANALPTWVVPLSASNETVIDLSLRTLLAHGGNYGKDNFSDPVILIHVVATNSLPAAADWIYLVELLTENIEPSALALAPLVELPYSYGGRIPLEIWRGPREVLLNADVDYHSFPLNFGATRYFKTKYRCLSFPEALASFIHGYGGYLCGRIVHIGTSMVSCALHVVVDWSDMTTTLSDLLRLPGQRLPSGQGNFRIPMYSPFGRTSAHDPTAHLKVINIGGPLSASTLKVSYQYMIYFECIEEDVTIPRLIGGCDEFVWARFKDFKDSGEWTLTVPTRLSTSKTDSCEVTMFNSPLAKLVSTCGFMQGRMTFTVRWTSSMSDQFHGGVSLTHLLGTVENPFGNALIFNTIARQMMIGDSISMDVDVGNFSGYSASGGTPHIREPVLHFAASDGGRLLEVYVNVQLHAGFRFYGRSVALPDGVKTITVPAGNSGGGSATTAAVAGNTSSQLGYNKAHSDKPVG